MSSFPGGLLDGLKSGDASRRLGLVFVGLALVGLVWGVSRWAGAPSYVALYRDLDLKEAAAMADQLKKSAVPYRLGDGGSAIEVPASEAARARVTLAKEGLPSGGRPGLELFDKTSWGMTDFTQRVTYQRALEGELARSIAGIRGIEKAQVHLVLPNDSPLRKEDRPAGAAVVVTLKPNTQLPSETVQGITYLVANSVEELASDNVAVIDDAGRVLSAPASSGAGAATTRQMEIQRTIEEHLASRVEDMLATTLGEGAARVQVAADLNFDQVERTIDTFDPDKQVLQSEQRGETSAGGTAAATTSENGSETVVNNTYQNSRSLEKILGSVGTVKRLSVAVLVDEQMLAKRSTGPRDAEMARLDALVKSAIGADSTRGDRVNVVAMPFQPVTAAAGASATAKDAAAKPPSEMIYAVERVSRPLVGIVAIVVLLLMAMKLLTGGGGAAPAPAESPASGVNGWSANGATNGAQGFGPVRMRAQAETLERPEATAEVLRGWLGADGQ